MAVLEKLPIGAAAGDLAGHEGQLSSQRGLQRSCQPATGHLLQPDALRAALLPSLTPHSVRLRSQEERASVTLPRGLICSGLAVFAPELLHWFQYAYGGLSPLFCQGELITHMATECKQGDTFGSLLYAVGFQSTLRAVQDALAVQIQDHAGSCSTTGEGLRLY
jgi:hypothetical protein